MKVLGSVAMKWKGSRKRETETKKRGDVHEKEKAARSRVGRRQQKIDNGMKSVGT